MKRVHAQRHGPRLGALCALVFASTPVAAATLSEDTVWSGDVLVAEDLDVPAGVTLTVRPGTTVRLEDGVTIRVSGRIEAAGTLAERILFTRNDDADRWGRILFVEAADSRLEHCIFEYSDCEGDHKDYYDDTDGDCQPRADRPPRDYFQAIVIIACHVDIESCLFRNLPDGAGGDEGDAIAVISDDPLTPGAATAVIRDCEFIGIGQGVHTRYSYVLVEDCYFTGHNGDNDDIDLYGESDPPPLILNNVMINPDHDDMINPTRCSAVIIGNIIAGSDDHGIVLRDRCEPVLINNLIFDCSSAGIAVQNQCNALLINNTIWDCGRAVRFFDHTGRWGRPYCLFPGSGSATLINCAIWNCDTVFELQNSPYEKQPGSHVTVSYSNVQGGGESRVSISSNSTLTWGEGNIDVEPMFVDPANGDFRLQSLSPLIDAGTAEQAPTLDIHGVSRPCGGGVDIGATEFGDCTNPDPIETRFRRGDSNADGVQDISDAVFVLLYLFAGGRAPNCDKAADATDDGRLDTSDAVRILARLFQNGPLHPAPYPDCGTDPTADDLECTAYTPCEAD